jgi:small subunit ribosomal protein S8e
MRLGRKISGGKYHRARKKKLYEIDRQPRIVKLGEMKKRTLRVLGGHYKDVLLSVNTVCLMNTKTGKTKMAKITNVVETPSNKFLAKQNIITKGAIIETDAGKARVTNRPSQAGMIQAVLIE